MRVHTGAIRVKGIIIRASWESAEILISIIRRPKPIDYRLKSAEVISPN